MNKAAWSIKGVDYDAREAARDAAEREGLSLGEWLNEAIAERAADADDERDADSDDDRLSSVSARIARMREDGARAKRRSDRRSGRARDDGRDDEAGRRRGARTLSRKASAREVSWREADDAEALIEDALASFERRANRGQEKTARALADVAELIETSQGRRDREGRALESISQRLAEIEQRVGRGADEGDYRPIRGALSRLESGLGSLQNDNGGARSGAGLRDIDSKLAEIAANLERGAGPAGRAGEEDRLARIEGQIATLATQIERASTRTPLRAVAAASAAARPAAGDAVSQIMRRQRELDGDAPLGFAAARAAPRPPFDARRAPSELETRLASIVERLERRLPGDDEAAGAAQPAAALTGLQGDIARMSQHIEKMREDIEKRPGAIAGADALEHVRREIAAVSRGLGELAPRGSISSLERAVREIADRLEIARIEGVRDAVATPIEQLARDLRAGLRELDPRAAIGALEQDVRAIAAKIENLEVRGGVDPQTIRAIFDQTREVRDLLSRAADASHSGERAQRELANLAARLDNGGGVAPAEIAHVVDEIRSAVSLSGGTGAVQALEQRIEKLSDRIDAALSGAGGEQMAVFGDRLDKLHRAVAQSLAAPRSTSTADTRQLEKLVQELADKVDRAASPGSGRDDLAALQTQIELLSRKIDRVGDRDESTAGLERMISDLFAQLNETRNEAFEAAENAARNAARDTVREALANVTTSGQGELGREIANLRAIQDTSDQRTHATLKAVHATLERVVDRLATLEDDLVESRTTTPPSRQSPAVEAPVAQPASQPVAPKPAAQTAASQSQGSTISAAAALARLKGVKPETRKAEAPSQRSAAPSVSLGQDVLIEPGAGLGRRPATQAEDAEDRSAQAGFIAAARRAALAAQAASVAAEEGESVDAAEKAETGGRLAQVRSVYERRRKPILLSLAALIGLLGALQIARVYTRNSGLADPPAPITRQVDPAPSAVPPAGDQSPLPAQPDKGAENGAPSSPAKESGSAVGPKAEMTAPTDASTPSAANAEAPAPRRVDAPSALPTMARQPRADARQIDPAPVGAISRAAASMTPLPTLEKAAAKGDAAAQYELASRYADGAQAPRDLGLAVKWFEKSAAKGVAPAQYRLGVLYERGLGVQRDMTSARSWYERAAESGNVRAMHNLAVLLADGGGKPDYASAAKWFRRAAEYGVRDSQYNLAILYARGMGGPQDLVQSYAWFCAAADQGDADAAKKRDEVASRFDAKTLARAKAIAESYRPKQPSAAGNEVTPPPGGWQPSEGPAQDGRPTSQRPKVSRL